jgi:hypothetical protein
VMRKCFPVKDTFRSQEPLDLLLQFAEPIQGNLDLLPFDEAVRTVAQGFAPSKDSGLGDLDAFEKNLAVGFLQGGFLFELPPSEPRSGTEDESLRETIGRFLIREAERFKCQHRKKRDGLRLPGSVHAFVRRSTWEQGTTGWTAFSSGSVSSKNTPLSFRSQVYRRGVCLLPAAKQQILRATLPRFGMTFLLGIFKLHRYRMLVAVDLTDANH